MNILLYVLFVLCYVLVNHGCACTCSPRSYSNMRHRLIYSLTSMPQASERHRLRAVPVGTARTGPRKPPIEVARDRMRFLEIMPDYHRLNGISARTCFLCCRLDCLWDRPINVATGPSGFRHERFGQVMLQNTCSSHPTFVHVRLLCTDRGMCLRGESHND